MRPLLIPLLACACAGLVGLGISSLLILKLHRRDEQRRRRIAAATEPYFPAGAAELVSLFRRARIGRMAMLGRRAASLIKYDPTRRDIYPLPWWAVLGMALALGRGTAGALSGLLGPFSMALVPVGTIFFARSFFGWCDAKRSSLLFRQMPDALAMIVRSVRVGIPMQEALHIVAREAAAPTANEFALLGNRVLIGLPLDEALREMADRNSLAEYRFFATALSLQSQTGGGLTETLENLADVIRKRVALRARGYALASEARSSAGILTALPIVTGLANYVLNPRYASLLFTNPTGHKIFGMAVVSMAFGLYVMRSMIRRSLS